MIVFQPGGIFLQAAANHGREPDADASWAVIWGWGQHEEGRKGKKASDWLQRGREAAASQPG